MKAFVKSATNGVVRKLDTPIAGKTPQFWSKQGVTVFFFEDDHWYPDKSPGEMVMAFPGMVGVNYQGTALFCVMADGECVKLTDLRDQLPRAIVRSTGIDQMVGELESNGESHQIS